MIHKNDLQKFDVTQKIGCDLKDYSQKWFYKMRHQNMIKKNESN